MSFFEDASLVLIPSGYKASKVYSVKPTDGTGDLTFTRSLDTATRVGPDGLIEKVRTNLALFSEQFDNAVYTKNQSTIAANVGVAPDGTTTADKLIMDNGQSPTSGDNSGWRQNTAIASGIYAFSFFAKAAEFSSVNIRENFNSGAFLNINLTNGVVTNPSQTEFIDASATNVGNGWFRIAWGAPSGTSNIQKYNIRAGVTGDGTSGFLNWGFQVETGDIATPYIGPTTNAAVSVGMLANVPRLDYYDTTCPHLLLEPQRTNSTTFSEQFDNAAWTKAADVILTANYGTSPDGTQSADRAVATAATGGHIVFRAISTTGTHTISIFAKASGYDYLFFGFDGGNLNFGIVFDLSNGTISRNPAGLTGTIEDIGTDGWYRCTLTRNYATTNDFFVVAPHDNTNNYNWTGNGTDGVLIWGAQTEFNSSFATSYIPTLAAAVTRSADTMSLAALNNADMTFTAFLELEEVPLGTNTSDWLVIGPPFLGRAFGFSNIFGFADDYNLVATSKTKMIWKQESGSTAKVFGDGVLLGTSTNGTYSTPFTVFSIFGEFLLKPLNIKQFIYFANNISDAQCIELTA